MTRPHYLADEVRARLARYEEMAAELVALRASLAAAQSRVAALEEIVRLLMREGHKITDPDAPTLGWADAVCAARAALASPPPHDGIVSCSYNAWCALPTAHSGPCLSRSEVKDLLMDAPPPHDGPAWTMQGCPECLGTGKEGTGQPSGEGGEEYRECFRCQGSGFVPFPSAPPPHDGERSAPAAPKAPEPCDDCDGTGWLTFSDGTRAKCMACSGRGVTADGEGS